MTATQTITLFRLDGYWMARHSDPMVKQLFGTDILPTPYSSASPSRAVKERIEELNPNAIVVLALGVK